MNTLSKKYQNQTNTYFEIKNLEVSVDNSQNQSPERVSKYVIIVVQEGEGNHIIDYSTYALNAKEVHFLVPGQIHIIRPKTDLKITQIEFSKELLIKNNFSKNFLNGFKMFKSFGHNPPIKFEHDDFSYLRNICEQMIESNQYSDEHTLFSIGALLKLFLIKCKRSSKPENQSQERLSKNSIVFNEFHDILEQDFKVNHKVRYYSEKLNISSKYLSEIIFKTTGRTAKSIIQQKLLSESKRLLLHTDLSIKEISYEIGFNEPLHYSSFFKKKVGISPSAYRAQDFSTFRQESLVA